MSPCHWVSTYSNTYSDVVSKLLITFWHFYSFHLLLTSILGLVNVLWQSLIFLFLLNPWKHSLLTKECQDGQCTTWRPIYYLKCTGKCWSKICSLFHLKKQLTCLETIFKWNLLPYWFLYFRGRWEGPRAFRKMFHLGMSR